MVLPPGAPKIWKAAEAPDQRGKDSVYRGSGYEGGLCDYEGQRPRLLAAGDFPVYILYISGAGKKNAGGESGFRRMKKNCLKDTFFVLT